MGDEETEGPRENNFYLDHLEEWHGTVLPNCRETLSENGAAPEQTVATKVAAGWVCTEADTWIAELHEVCSGVTGAFDDAIATVGSAKNGQDATVPADHEHGLAYQRAQQRIQGSGRRPGPTPY
jgi:hypothetical protein